MITGRTYTLNQPGRNADRYYGLVGSLADRFLVIEPDVKALRRILREAGSWKGFLRVFSRRKGLTGWMLRELESSLNSFLTGLDEHLRALSVAGWFDRTLRTTRDQYLLSMIEIELTNRINREGFARASWRMALIAHCLRDFRSGCRLKYGDIEGTCARCDPECFVNRGWEMLERYNIHPFVSVSMDHGKLFRRILKLHPDIGVLGIACIPELVTGMRLCEGMDIPALGVPLDANRCSRWMGECMETTFSLAELEKLIKSVPGA